MDDNELVSKKYELMLLFSGQLIESEIEKALSQIKELITEKKGDVFYEDVWGRRDLGYRIRKERTAYYILLNFNLDSSLLLDISKALKLDPRVLRYLLTQVPSGYQAQKFNEEDIVKIFSAQKEKREEQNKRKPVKKEGLMDKIEIEEEPKEEKKEEKVEEVEEVKEEVAEIKEEKEEPEEKREEETTRKTKQKLDAVEEKLRDIISDKDLNL